MIVKQLHTWGRNSILMLLAALLSSCLGSATVTAPTLQSIVVTPATQTISANASAQFTATGNYSDGTARDISSLVTWSLSDTTVASVTSSGRVTGLTTGQITVTATVGTITANAALIVSVVGSSSGTFPVSANTTAQNMVFNTIMSNFSPLTPSGGTPPYTYSVTSGTLPTGVSLNATTGVVSGVAIYAYATANVVFSVLDTIGLTGSTTSAVSFTVSGANVSNGGLTWMPVTTTTYTYTDANTLCSGSIQSLTGWRLPTDLELSALYTSGAMSHQGWMLGKTWSSVSSVAGQHNDVDLFSGTASYDFDTNLHYATCVR